MSAANPYAARGLDPELAAKYGAGFRDGKFVFEYRSKGALRYRKWRTLTKKFYAEPSGVPPILWGLDSIEGLPSHPSFPLVITEGEPDRLAALQSVGGYAVSVPNGAGMASPTQPGKLVADDQAFAFLWGPDERLIPELTNFTRIILAVDNDAKGLVLRNELAIRLGRSRCWTVEYPSGCKDLNDVLFKYGPAAVKHVLDNARPIQPGKLIKPSQVRPIEFNQTYSTGWKFMDPIIKLTRPELAVITGIPGHGKGVFTRSLCYHLAEDYGIRTAFWTPEDRADRVKRDMKRFAMRHNMWPGKAEQNRADEWMDAHFMISELLDDDVPTIERLLEEVESAVFHHNCQAFVIDPWNVIRHSMGSMPETRYIEETLEIIKSKLRQLCIMLFLVAHPTKIKDGEKVTMYSISGSSNWYNKADHGVIVSRGVDSFGQKTDVTTITVEKSKDEETMGSTGKVMVKYDRDKADYTEVPMAA